MLKVDLVKSDENNCECYDQALLKRRVSHVLQIRKKNMVHFLQYLKLPINAHGVIGNFECIDIYLIHTAKEIFRKFPKIDFLKFILILPQVFYLIELTRLAKNNFLCQH